MTTSADPETRIPEAYLRDVLASSHDIAELKVILQVVRLGNGASGPAVPHRALLSADVLRATVGLDSPEPAEERLQRALNRAVANGFLLRVTVGDEAWFLAATPAGHDALDRVRAGIPGAPESVGLPAGADVTIFRPNLFSLYERHIGPLTPLVAERLRDAERSYPRAWIEQGMLSAVHYNKRSWAYVEAILARWERAGGPDEAHG